MIPNDRVSLSYVEPMKKNFIIADKVPIQRCVYDLSLALYSYKLISN
jgi:hypothetical protein